MITFAAGKAKADPDDHEPTAPAFSAPLKPVFNPYRFDLIHKIHIPWTYPFTHETKNIIRETPGDGTQAGATLRSEKQSDKEGMIGIESLSASSPIRFIINCLRGQ